MKRRKKWMPVFLILAMFVSMLPTGVAAADAGCSTAIEVSDESVETGGTFTASLVLKGSGKAPAAAQIEASFENAVCTGVEKGTPADTDATFSDGTCLVSYYGYEGDFDSDGKLVLAVYTFEMGDADAKLKITGAGAGVSGQTADIDITPAEGESDVTVALNIPSEPWEGSGTEEDPYRISNAEELQALAENVNKGKDYAGKQFVLTDDIDLSTVCGASGFDSDGNYDGKSSNRKNWPVIGSYIDGTNNNTFRGNFNGQGHVVQNIFYDYNGSINAAGLFGYIADGIIENLSNTGSMETNGGAVAYSAQNEIFRNCINIVDVSSRSSGAGILNRAAGGSVIVDRCVNYGNIKGTSVSANMSGIVQSIRGSCTLTITDCANYGEVRGNGVAGITNSGATVTGCVNRGTISSSSAFAKGIAGKVVSDCYNVGDVNSSRNASDYGYLAFGITSGITGSGNTPQSVTNCYNAGKITSLSKGTYTEMSGGYFPICYSNYNDVTNCYYLDTSVGESQAGFDFYGTADSSDELKQRAGDLGSRFRADAANINNGYPILDWEDVPTSIVTFSYTSPVEETVLTVNGNVMNSGDRLNVPVGGTVRITLTGFNPGNYKVGSVTVNRDTELTSASDGSYSFVVTEDSEVDISVIKLSSDQTRPGDNAGPILGGVSTSQKWDGTSVDVSWYFGHEMDTVYEIDTPAELAGVAALVNGLVNEDCVVSVSDTRTYPASEWNQSIGSYVFKSETDGSGGNGLNMSTDTYHYGIEDFHEKTIVLAENLDMGGIYNENTDQWSGPNYMPVGGQYLMKKNDSSTKLSSSFCGTFDGNGHYVLNVYCDRHCSNGNFGDGQSVGLIGRLGVHDNDPAELRPVNPTVKNVGVTGYLYSNRSVGGIVGKTGKTAYNNGTEGGWSLIQNCVNYARVIGTDAKGTGGVVGAFWNGGRMENCYNAGHVTGGWPAGGVASSNENTMVNCYNVGTVDSASGDNWAMSLGTNNGGAPMKAVTNCWYLDGSSPGGGYFTSSKPENSGAMTAEEMKSETFVTTLGDAFNKDTGHINNGYPILKWQGGTKPEDHDLICPSKAFTDLDTSKWYHEAIDYVLLKNYFNGVGDGKFEPDGTMTRAMFVTVLGRAAGVEEDKNAHSSFGDVADGKWYTAYVDWAAKNGIVN